MEGNIISAVSASSIASERRGSDDGRRAKVKASKDDDARKMTVENNSQGDSAEASSVGIFSENKSKKGIKPVNLRKSKSLSRLIGGGGGGADEGGGGGDLSNAGVNTELAKRKQSEARPGEKSFSEKNRRRSIATVDGAFKERKGEASVSNRTPDRKTRQLPNIEKPDMRRAVENWKKHAFKTGSRMNLFRVVQTVPSEYLTRARGSEVIQPTVNGLRQFGISKGEISRVIVKFSSPPPPHPLTICFHFPSTFLTHRYVLDMIRVLIQGVEGARVTSIQFIDRNTIHGARGLDNRWLIKVNMAEARDVILNQGLQLFNRRILVRMYDDILREEYEEFLEYAQLRRKLYVKMEDAAIEEELEAEAFESEQAGLSESQETLSNSD